MAHHIFADKSEEYINAQVIAWVSSSYFIYYDNDDIDVS